VLKLQLTWQKKPFYFIDGENVKTAFETLMMQHKPELHSACNGFSPYSPGFKSLVFRIYAD
jgi:hypothetical protein